MDRYNKMTPCAKCGAVGATTEYHDGKGAYTDQGRKLPPYLWRTCARCGYGWQEAPLDAVEPPPLKARKHIESYDSEAVCICGEKVVAYRDGLYVCPKGIATSKKAG